MGQVSEETHFQHCGDGATSTTRATIDNTGSTVSTCMAIAQSTCFDYRANAINNPTDGAIVQCFDGVL